MNNKENKVYKCLYLKSIFDENKVKILIYSRPNNEIANDSQCDSLIVKALEKYYTVTKNETFFDREEIQLPEFVKKEYKNGSIFLNGSSQKYENSIEPDGIRILLLPETKHTYKESNDWYDINMNMNIKYIYRINIPYLKNSEEIDTEKNITILKTNPTDKGTDNFTKFDISVRCDPTYIKKFEKIPDFVEDQTELPK